MLGRALMILLLAVAGCVPAEPINPSFAVTPDVARATLRADTDRPVRLQRPVVVIGGFLDPGVAAAVLAADVRRATGEDRVIDIELGTFFTLDACRRHVIDVVNHVFPNADPSTTVEVDVIGYSLGGVVARFAANPGSTDCRLRIGRLFTISSPLRGAIAATVLSTDLHPVQGPLRPGSLFLTRLNAARELGAFPVSSYVCLNDETVGAMNAALPGRTPWWVAAPRFVSAHDWAFLDDRIVADIVARLRGDPPFSSDPPAPLPSDPR